MIYLQKKFLTEINFFSKQYLSINPILRLTFKNNNFYTQRLNLIRSNNCFYKSILIKNFFTDNNYEKIVNETLESLQVFYENVLDNQTKIKNYDLSLSNGVLTIDLDSFGVYIINKQSPNKQIWLSSPISGPKRYDYVDGKWIYKYDKKTLHELLNQELSLLISSKINEN